MDKVEKTIANTLTNRDHLLIQALHQQPLEISAQGDKLRMNVVGAAYAEGRSTQRQRHALLQRLIGRE
jgi:acid stress-induced BolA-like protein IbaG/YrbA